MVRRILVVLAVAAIAVAALACTGGSDKKTAASSPQTQGSSAGKAPVTGRVTVFAAASLTDAFNEIGTAFRAANPGANVTFNFAGSPTLRTQLDQGAKADIYASADTANMNMAVHSGSVTNDGKVFARNTLTVITPSSGTPKVTSLADLGKSGVKLVLANAQVPAGSYAHQMLANMERDPAYGLGWSDKVLRNLASEESDVKQVVAKVQLGEADAGVVYGTDVTPSVAPQLKMIDVPQQFNVIAEYPIATVKGAGNAAGARAFIEFVLAPAGQAILKKYGFQPVAPTS